MSSRLLLTATFVVAVLLAGWLWYSPESTRRGGDVSPAGGREPADSKGLTGEGNDSSPFALASGAAAADASGSTVASGSGPGGTSGDTASGPGTNPDSPPAVSLLPVDITRIARATLSDEEHEYLVQRLRDDPALLQQMIDEFRQEPDQARRDRLLQLLGEAGGDAVTRTASELIFSGDEASRKSGLALLQLVQPGNPEARDIVSGMLATEVQPDVLIDTLTTLADPGSVDDNSRAFLADQVSLLTSHEDAAVRSISLSILSRWSTDGRDTPVLLDALQDTEQGVRQSAAYALVGHEVVNQSVIDSLWAVAVDDGDTKATRSAAVLALRGMQLSDAQRRDLAAVQRELATVARRQ